MHLPHRTNVRPTPVARLIALSVLFGAAMLAGCTAFERGADQGDPDIHPVTGCPDISGSYALEPASVSGQPDPDGKRAVLDAGLFAPRVHPGIGPGPLAQFHGVVFTMQDTWAIDARFVSDPQAVMATMDHLREHQRPRYADWYRLLQPEGREAFIAERGPNAWRERVAELGPEADAVVTLQRGRDYTCEDGWLVLPREYQQPVRVTLDDDGHLVFESKEWTRTPFGGWGDSTFSLPTGAYLGTAQWPRDASIVPWDVEALAREGRIRPPIGVRIEGQPLQPEDIQQQVQRSAERRFAKPAAIREALTPLLPDGVTMAAVDLQPLPFIGYRVRVHAVPSDPSMDSEEQRRRLEWFLAALKDGDPGFIEDREVVKRVISSGGRLRHEFEIFLDTHPAVQPGTGAADAGDTVTDAGGAQGVARSAGTNAPRPLASSAPSSPDIAVTPRGFVDLDVVRARLEPHWANGCTLAELRYSGTAVQLIGFADTQAAVSQSMRAIDAAIRDSADEGRHLELVQISAEPGGRYRFELRLPPSALTKV
jgi:hypothetical protein